MNYTHSMNPAGQGIAIGNNFCNFHTRKSISCYCTNDESEMEKDYVKLAIIRNLREARKELKRGFTFSTDAHIDYCLSLITSKYPRCEKCNCPLNIPNLSGICEHKISITKIINSRGVKD